MKLLITGASGLIGRYVLDSFRNADHDIIAAYRNNRPHIEGPGSARVRLLKIDLCERIEGIDPVDIVIHAAGRTNLIAGSSANDYVRSNVVTTLNLANYAKATKASLFINLSTISMYGEASGIELHEDAPMNNPGIYGISKYLGELTLKDFAESFPSVSIRLPGVVGPGYFGPWIGSVLRKAFQNEPISIYNPEFNFNNIVHLADIARFMSSIIESGAHGYDNVNLAADAPITIREVAQLIISLTGSESEILEQDIPGNSFLIGQDKIKSLFHFQPATTRSTIRRYVSENLGSLSRPKGMGVTT